MSYSTSSPGSETASVPKRRVAALFAACLMLLTTAGVGVAATAGAAQPRPVANPGTVNVTTPAISDEAPVGSIKVNWTVPVPSDFTTGYLVLVQKSPTWVDGDSFQVYPVAGLNTTSLIIKNLGWETAPLGGTAYSVIVLATNGEGSEAFIDYQMSILHQSATGATSFPPAVTPPTQPKPAPRYEFPTIDAMINAHYMEFLNRAPTFVERNLWQDVFQREGQNLACDGVDQSTNPATNPAPSFDSPAMAWGPAPIVTEAASPSGAQNCPNFGTEYDMISILRTGGAPDWFVDSEATVPAGHYPQAIFDGWDQPNSAWFYSENPTTYQGIANPIIRLYFAYFDRVPDQAGFEYWTDQFRNGKGSLDYIANFFANSPEFKKTYPTIQTNADFVSMVYFNVLHRVPDANGMAYWVAQLRNGGASKGRVMNQFAQSDENIDVTYGQVAITNIYAALLKRMPTNNELAANAFWAGTANFGHVSENVWVIQGAVRNSAEYAALQG